VLVLVYTESGLPTPDTALARSARYFIRPRGQNARTRAKAPVKDHGLAGGGEDAGRDVRRRGLHRRGAGLSRADQEEVKEASPVVPVWLDMGDAMKKTYARPGWRMWCIRQDRGPPSACGQLDEAQFAISRRPSTRGRSDFGSRRFEEACGRFFEASRTETVMRVFDSAPRVRRGRRHYFSTDRRAVFRGR